MRYNVSDPIKIYELLNCYAFSRYKGFFEIIKVESYSLNWFILSNIIYSVKNPLSGWNTEISK